MANAQQNTRLIPGKIAVKIRKFARSKNRLEADLAFISSWVDWINKRHKSATNLATSYDGTMAVLAHVLSAMLGNPAVAPLDNNIAMQTKFAEATNTLRTAIEMYNAQAVALVNKQQANASEAFNNAILKTHKVKP